MNDQTRTTAPRISKGAQPSFFEQPATEALYGMFVVMLEELCVLRDRLDTYERLGEQGIAVTSAAVEAYEPDDSVEQAREQLRHGTINRAMRPVKALQEAAVKRAQSQYEQAARSIAEQEI
ncbi:MAG: hypothetical protein JSV45_03950 [Chromatiales bacterium]|nr:MAG: hypothetical protein JSV45_03950 [Chromatiales bacterium]